MGFFNSSWIMFVYCLHNKTRIFKVITSSKSSDFRIKKRKSDNVMQQYRKKLNPLKYAGDIFRSGNQSRGKSQIAIISLAFRPLLGKAGGLCWQASRGVL